MIFRNANGAFKMFEVAFYFAVDADNGSTAGNSHAGSNHRSPFSNCIATRACFAA